MSTLEKIAYFQNRRDEVPNQELARELAGKKDGTGIKEIADNLWHKNKSVRSDCLKVLYEIGYINPSLIAGYVGEFIQLLNDRENRMVWGGMIALATIADLRPVEIWGHIEEVISAIENGTLITYVWGIKTLAHVARVDRRYHERLFPLLMGYLKTCNPRDLPLHAESVSFDVDDNNRAEFTAVLRARMDELKPSQQARLEKLLKTLP